MSFKLDTRAFKNALEQYRRVTKRDMVEVVNKKTKDVVLRAARATPKAQKESIRALGKKDWWPKYIAKVISRTGVRVSLVHKRKGKTRTRVFVVKGRYTRGQARTVSRNILSKRSRGTGYLRAAILKAGKPFGVLAAGNAETLQRAKGVGRKANSVFLRSQLKLIYESARGKKSATRARDIVQKVMQQAVDEVGADMLAYVRRKLAERGRQFSGK